MKLNKRIDLLVQLGNYMLSEEEAWQAAKQRAFADNSWFTQEFVNLASKNIAKQFLQSEKLEKLISQYSILSDNEFPKKVGIAMAGNVPLVGFHDLMCIFLTGHQAVVKPSSKDAVLIKHLMEKLIEWDHEASHYLILAEMLKSCDAYIATGSNNTARYFEYYFRNHPHIIRKNRTSVALLTGKETEEELEHLADDVYQYFGLGCRNVTKIYVPEGYDFVPLLKAFKKYNYLIDHNKYKNNYDYNLAVHILNNKFYMTNGSILLIEDASPFSRISQLHYEFYTDLKHVQENLQNNDSIQCVVGVDNINFGEAQCPAINTFADNVDTIQFLLNLSSK